jgi:anti-sigma factor RsiW
MSKPGPLSDAEREDLVAYLDGELAGEAKRQMEVRLSLDPRWRAEAEALKRTWDLLDFLPRPEPSPDFTQRTLSRLEPIRKPEKRPEPTPVEHLKFRPRWAGLAASWAAVVLIAGLGGYYLAGGGASRLPGEAELTRDLRIIENKRYYDVVEDMEFLRAVDRSGLFGEEAVGG